MKLLLDFLPIVVFFVCFKFAGIYVATAAAIAVTISQLAWMALTGRKIEPMQWVGLAIIVVFGGATLWLQDESFIKWKPTVLYALFAAILGIARLRGRNLLTSLLKAQMQLPAPIWDQLNLLWIVFFAAMAVANYVVANLFSTEIWVNFKLFGTMGLTVLFVIAQAIYLNRHLVPPDLPASAEPVEPAKGNP